MNLNYSAFVLANWNKLHLKQVKPVLPSSGLIFAQLLYKNYDI